LKEKAAQLPGGLFVSHEKVKKRVAHGWKGNSGNYSSYSGVERYPPHVVSSVLWEGCMFRDGCGAPLQPEQAFCSKCGKQIVGQTATAQSLPAPGRVRQHVHLPGILWFAFRRSMDCSDWFFVILGGILIPHLREMKDMPSDAPVDFISAPFTTIEF
jgi:hypothetical protein